MSRIIQEKYNASDDKKEKSGHCKKVERINRELETIRNQWLDLQEIGKDISNDGGLTMTISKYKRRMQMLDEMARKGSGEVSYSVQIEEGLRYIDNRESALEDELRSMAS